MPGRRSALDEDDPLRSTLSALAVSAFAAAVMGLLAPAPAFAAESTTGVIIGTITTAAGAPIAGARIAAASPSGTYTTTSDARGRYQILGVSPDTYAISVEATGYAAALETGVAVLPNSTRTDTVTLSMQLRTIATVTARGNAFDLGSTSDSFTVTGSSARARSPIANGAGLGSYIAGTVQGAIANVPGVDLDGFANTILRGGETKDAIFDFDSIPIPQGLIAEPGGNVVGAQLATTGIASTNVTLAGYTTQLQNTLGGVIDQIPAVGTYPGSTTLELGIGSLAQYGLATEEILGATPDLKVRYALSSTFGSQYFAYGDGSTFYPSEAATYGLALQNRGEYSVTGNVHVKLDPKDDVSVLGLIGQANYRQYASPYAGETVGAFDGTTTTFPGETNPAAAVTYASGVRGNYDIIKAQLLRSGATSLTRIQLYQSQYGSSSGGPFWDENGFPNGAFSLRTAQNTRETGLSYDGDYYFGSRHRVQLGGSFRNDRFVLDQVVPTADEFINSKPVLDSYLAFLGDTWRATDRLTLTAFGRATGTRVIPSTGTSYSTGALDPHASVAFRLGRLYALRASFDHNTVAPAPLEAERIDSAKRAPFTPLASSSSNDFTYSFEGGGKTQFRATYYANYDKNRIDVLPFNFRSSTAASQSQSQSGIGVPTNAGQLVSHGAELYVHTGGFAFDANYVRAMSSSASQFAYNSLNPAVIEAGHLLPAGYVPALTATMSYTVPLAHDRIRVTPQFSFETGYPYGNGREIFRLDPTTGKPVRVMNDNYVNPGFNYYFLRNPTMPFNATSNPYISDLGTPEGNDPNTLTSPPHTLLNLHIEGDLSPRLTAIFDVTNVLGDFTPTQLQGNPYLIGPPGYAGTNDPASPYANFEANAGAGTPYLLGNGVPTNDGVKQAVPWQYGRGGYVAESYPLGRTIEIRLRYRM